MAPAREHGGMVESGGASCPFIGIADDERSRFSYPNAAHRCRATGRPLKVSAAHQGEYCLGPGYAACERLPVSTEPARLRVAVIGPIRDAGPWMPGGWRAVTTRRVLASAALTAVVFIALGVAVLGSGPGPGGTGPSGERQTAPSIVAGSMPATSAPLATWAPTATPTPVTPTATPAAVPTPTPTVRPTSAPTANPAPTPTIRRVRPGDTLFAIAEEYGVTVEAIIEANDISDPHVIIVGQRLLIPLP